MENGRTFGALSIYAAEADAFDEEELRLLTNLAGNLAYGISALRNQKERRRAEEGLQCYMKKLEQSNQALQDFASIASHDMQEPLRKIISFGGQLQVKCGDGLGETGRDYLERIQKAASRMQTLLQSLLAYSRVTTKAEPFVAIDLADLLFEVVDDLEVRVVETNATIEIGRLPMIEADHHQIRQLFQNLIGNALKYSRKDERPIIRIYGDVQDGVARVFVDDNGIGFDEKYLDRIFKPFQRLHGRTSSFEGTGMGLAIVRKIVERHGGSITAISAPGKGSTFIVILPVKEKSNAHPLR
jgi:light-regulated signal transduction histidine kinase (bacteriophytochrome)